VPWLVLAVAALFLLTRKETAMSTERMRVTGYRRGEPVEIEVSEIAPGKWLRFDAAAAFLKMAGDASTVDGVTFQVNSAWRSYASQAVLYAKYRAGTGNLAAPPGYSSHEAGLAVDVESAGGTNAAVRWLRVNAGRYGFAATVKSEPWHWEYVSGLNTV